MSRVLWRIKGRHKALSSNGGQNGRRDGIERWYGRSTQASMRYAPTLKVADEALAPFAAGADKAGERPL